MNYILINKRIIDDIEIVEYNENYVILMNGMKIEGKWVEVFKLRRRFYTLEQITAMHNEITMILQNQLMQKSNK